MKYDEKTARKQKVLAAVLYASCILTRQAHWYSVCPTGLGSESVDCRSGSPPDRVGDQGGTPASLNISRGSFSVPRCKPKACLPFWQFHFSCTREDQDTKTETPHEP